MKKNNVYLLFLLAVIITFSCICLLQFIEFPVFIVVLVSMHVGIALFIISKKIFTKKLGLNVKKFYIREYLLLALYIPVLIYKLLSKTGWYQVNVPVKTVVSLVITAFSVIISVINGVKLYKFIKE